MYWKSRDWASEAPKKLMEALRKELEANPKDEALRGHILQLKRAWGIRIRLPKKAA